MPMNNQGAYAPYLLFDARTTTGLGTPVLVPQVEKVVKAAVVGTGALTATIRIFGNTENNNTTGVLLGTITLSGTTRNDDGFAFDGPWPYLYAEITAITGTGAAVTVGVGGAK